MSRTKNLVDIREEAKAEGEARVRLDVDRTTGHIRLVLEDLAPIVLKAGVTIQDLCERHKIDPSSFYGRFTKRVGAPSGTYIAMVRGEIGEKMKRRYPWLTPADLVYVLGVCDEAAVRAAYKAFTGELPSESRRRGDVFDFNDADAVARLAADEPTIADLDRVLRYVDRKCPEHRLLRPASDGNAEEASAEHLGEPFVFEPDVWIAEGFLRELQKLDVDRWEAEVQHFAAPILYEPLHELARVEGRRDSERGVKIAAVALASVEAAKKRLGRLYPARYVVALAWRGNAQRLDLKFEDAEETFEACLEYVREHPELQGTAAEGEVLWLYGALRVTQRRDKDARLLLGQALKVYEKIDDVKGQVNVLNQRVQLAFYADDLGSASADLRQARRLLEGRKDFNLLQDVLTNLANCQGRRGRGQEAKETLRELRDIRGDRKPTIQQELLEFWIEGDVERRAGAFTEAEAIYRRVASGFGEVGDVLNQARARLDLALLLSEDGPSEEAVQLAVLILPVFRSLRLGTEARRCLAVLQEAVVQAEVEAEVLRLLRRALNADPLVKIAHPDV